MTRIDRRDNGRPLFAFVQTYLVHTPFKVDRRFDNGDAPYVVVLTSDHGEEIFERGAYDHRRNLHDEVLRVPLIVQFPGQAQSSIVAEPTSILDVVPTLLTVAGLPLSDAVVNEPLHENLIDDLLALGYLGEN